MVDIQGKELDNFKIPLLKNRQLDFVGIGHGKSYQCPIFYVLIPIHEIIDTTGIKLFLCHRTWE